MTLYRLLMPDDAGGGGGGAAAGAAAAGAGGASAGADAAAAASAAASAAAVKGATGAGDGKGGAASGGDGKGAAGAAASPWGDNWRETYAATDEAKLNVLKRYTDPRGALDALFAARQKIDSGELRAKLPANATPEQLAAYRKENGLPDSADGYLSKLPQGLELDDENKGRIKPFLDRALAKGYSQDIVNDFLEVREQLLDSLIESQVQADQQQRSQVEEQLRAEWGGDYLANRNNVTALLRGAPEEIRQEIMSARLPDGRALFNSKDVMQYFAGLARQVNPMTTLTGADGGALTSQSLDGEITHIESLMGNSESAYYRGPQADKMQSRYRELLDARESIKKRAA